MIVTIDGPAGSGKSTAARRLAQRLGFDFLDTGAMYRAAALAVLRAGVPLTEETRVADVVRTADISVAGSRVLLDGEDVSEEIRSPQVTHAASVVAQNAGVREALASRQREMARGKNIVTEGRDQGTVVFPGAECKIFLTASDAVRAERRRHELQAQGVQVSRDELLNQLRERDRRDRNRPVAPLRPADDAVVVDTTGLSVDEMLDQLEALTRSRLSAETDEPARHSPKN